MEPSDPASAVCLLVLALLFVGLGATVETLRWLMFLGFVLVIAAAMAIRGPRV